ncbi:GPP34 family phosphoprotein [Kineosporia rhizophila]|uniref:GOLPH3/VPS74 family protein n=1 Tax=Kineosporia TaxID=49184 RepID=UPI001E2E50FE|nr:MULTISPECIES: GPP34 family phosphoprotein [Kineosporia]MCE0535415.1 GPP34 family phosphoprotein [Kineosporia rhizophila]
MTGHGLEDFLIAEDLMLLLLDDEKGTIHSESSAPYLLAGALLSELTLLERVAQGEKEGLFGRRKLLPLGQGPLPDPLLQEAYDEVVDKPRDPQSVLSKISKDLHKRVPARLAERGLVRLEQKKVMRIFSQTRYPSIDQSRERAVRNEIRAVLADGLTARSRVAALIALLSAGNSLKHVLKEQDVSWTPEVKQRAKEIQKGDWGAGVASAAIAASVATIAGGAAAAGTYGGGDGGGDGGSGGGDGGGGGGS